MMTCGTGRRREAFLTGCWARRRLSDANFPRENNYNESHDRGERRIRHARPCARRTVAGAKAAWRLMPVQLLLVWLVLRSFSRRTRRDRQAANRELPIRLDVVRFLLCAEPQHTAELPARLDNIGFLVSAERPHAALGVTGYCLSLKGYSVRREVCSLRRAVGIPWFGLGTLRLAVHATPPGPPMGSAFRCFLRPARGPLDPISTRASTNLWNFDRYHCRGFDVERHHCGWIGDARIVHRGCSMLRRSVTHNGARGGRRD
jgi:hypothetical protein